MAATRGSIALVAGEGALELHEIAVKAELICGTSVSVVEMVFYNQHHRSGIEGELDFPLPEDAVVCGYEYEYQGKMVPASVVEKEVARVTFEQEMRSGGSVSLVEHVKGNSFKVRVYPLDSHKTKKVAITFMSDLPVVDGALQYQLPFVVDTPLKRFSLEISAAASHHPDVTSDLGEIDLHQHEATYDYTLKREDVKITPESLNVRIAVVEGGESVPAPDVYVGEKDLAIQGKPDEAYFLVQDYPTPDTAPASNKSGGKIAVVWDASFSMADIDRKREIELVKTMVGGAEEVGLVVFRNVSDPLVKFSGKNVNKLVSTLNDLIYDGATDIQNLEFPTGYDKILWFTDGFSTLSDDTPAKVPPNTPLYVFVNSVKANAKLLEYVADKTGGQYFNLIANKNDSSITEAVSNASAFRFLSVEYNKDDVTRVFPDNSFAVNAGEKVTVVGQLLVPTTTIKLHYGFTGVVTQTRTITLNKENSVGHSDVIPRLWAAKQSDNYVLLGQDENKDNLVQLGRKFGIVTPGTSLLVLTTLDQYLKHGIEPSAEALPELHDQYTSQKREKAKDEETKIKNKLDKAYGWWKTRTDWWDNDYTSGAKFAYKSIYEAAHPKQRDTARRSESLYDSSDAEESECCEDDLFSAAIEEKCNEKSVKKKKSAPTMAMKKSSAPKSSAGPMAPPPVQSSMAAPPPPPMLSAPIMQSQSFDMMNECAAASPSMMMDECERSEDEAPSAAADSAPGGGSVGPSGAGGSVASAGISIKSWTPDRPYLNAIKAASTVDAQYRNYVKQREEHGKAPSFFLDCAQYFLDKAETKSIGVTVVTSILELKLEDPRLLRLVANTLMLQHMYTQAIWLFNRIVTLRAEEPQTFRDLGVALLEDKQYQKAIDTWWKVLTGDWATRFQHIEDEVLLQINRAIWLANKNNANLDLTKVEERFRKHITLNVHCTITWDTDDTCIDLHINQPDGTRCFYGNYQTSIGGFSTPDYPGCTAFSTSMLREYMIKNAIPGTYQLGCNYYSNHRQDLTAGTTMWFTVTTNWCTDQENSSTTILRLECNSVSPSSSSSYDIGTVSYGISPLVQSWIYEWDPSAKPPTPEPTPKPTTTTNNNTTNNTTNNNTTNNNTTNNNTTTTTTTPTNTENTNKPSQTQVTENQEEKTEKKGGFMDKLKSVFGK